MPANGRGAETNEALWWRGRGQWQRCRDERGALVQARSAVQTSDEPRNVIENKQTSDLYAVFDLSCIFSEHV